MPKLEGIPGLVVEIANQTEKGDLVWKRILNRRGPHTYYGVEIPSSCGIITLVVYKTLTYKYGPEAGNEKIVLETSNGDGSTHSHSGFTHLDWLYTIVVAQVESK